ncbi:MAG TPA: DinB family protein [Longimicrobiaceae bacterium]|nr:DinB family protein [Longimicrobiaceae bacterium]
MTRGEIVRALAEVEREVAEFFVGLSADELMRREGEAWTAAEHLRHLDRSVRAVARGLEYPRWLLRLRFGRPRQTSRGYDEVRTVYRARLAAGGKSTPEFTPPREDVPAGEVDAYGARLLTRWADANARLRAAVERWPEEALDRIQLPHPLLGKLTVREMLFFTLYHDHHHVDGARRRLTAAATN